MRTLTLTVEISALNETQIDELEAALVAQLEDIDVGEYAVVKGEPKSLLLKAYIQMVERAYPDKPSGWAESQLRRVIRNAESVGEELDHYAMMEILCAEFGVGKWA